MTAHAALFKQYFADHGADADQPASDVEVDAITGEFHLSNINGELAVYEQVEPGQFVLVSGHLR